MRHYTTPELVAASNRIPTLVQNALSSEDTIRTISSLGTQFKLHVDQMGCLAELNVQMLLGLITPPDFLKELIATGIPEEEANQIIGEINKKIFVPLREQMKKQAMFTETRSQPKGPSQIPPPSYGAVAPVARPAPPAAPPRPVQQQALQQQVVRPSAAPPASPPQQFIRPATPPQTPVAPAQPPQVAQPLKPVSPAWRPPEHKIDELPKGFYAPPPQSPRYPGQADVSQYLKKVSEPVREQPINRLETGSLKQAVQAAIAKNEQISDSSRLLQDHEEPHINFDDKQSTPTQLWQSQPVRPRPSATPPPIRQYSSDPYRESVDEGEQ